jgi:hypothetical protein
VIVALVSILHKFISLVGVVLTLLVNDGKSYDRKVLNSKPDESEDNNDDNDVKLSFN